MFRYNEPLGLPRGSVAALLAILALAGLGMSIYLERPADGFFVLAGLLIGFCLGQRAAQEGDKPQSSPMPPTYKSLSLEERRGRKD